MRTGPIPRAWKHLAASWTGSDASCVADRDVPTGTPWAGQAHVTSLTISRLTRRNVGTIIDQLVGNKPLPAGLRQDIIERTDGIPLFVEEMTKAVLEAESED